MTKSKIVSFSRIKSLVSKLHAGKKHIVFTNGCFDLIHSGHVSYLAKTKLFGDVLIVGLNSDSSVRKIKGSSRPIVSQDDRAIVVAALEAVDYVCIFNDATPLRLIKIVKPCVLVKGADWRINKIVGVDFVKSYGGTVKTVALIPGRSTSAILKKIKNKIG